MKRSLALIFSLVILLTTVPQAVSATEFPNTLNIGDSITFGTYEQDNNFSNGSEALVWKVLEIQDGQALLITENIIEVDRYAQSDSMLEGMEESGLNWKTSYLRQSLNESFLSKAFTTEEAEKIVTSSVSTNDAYGTYTTNDQVFLLSKNEVKKYFSSTSAMAAKPTAYAKSKMNRDDAVSKKGYCTWWLRDMSEIYKETSAYNFMEGTYNIAYYIKYDEGIANDNGMVGFNDHFGIRPALRIQLSNTTATGTSAEEVAKPSSFAWPTTENNYSFPGGYKLNELSSKDFMWSGPVTKSCEGTLSDISVSNLSLYTNTITINFQDPANEQQGQEEFNKIEKELKRVYPTFKETNDYGPYMNTLSGLIALNSSGAKCIDYNRYYDSETSLCIEHIFWIWNNEYGHFLRYEELNDEK